MVQLGWDYPVGLGTRAIIVQFTVALLHVVPTESHQLNKAKSSNYILAPSFEYY